MALAISELATLQRGFRKPKQGAGNVSWPQILLKGAGFADIRQNFFTVLGYALVVNGLAVWSYRKRV